MFTSLTVENWKSIRTGTLHVDSLTVVIGTNSSGKSNLLDAFSFLSRISGGAMLTSALQGDGLLPPLRGGIEWAAQKPGQRFAVGITLRVNETQDLVYRIECETKANACELVSEKLERVRFRLDKRKEGRGSQSGRIQLFWSDTVPTDSPTIVARIYNSKRGTPKQLSRASSILSQLFGQKLPAEVGEGIEQLLFALRSIFILDPIPSHMRDFSALSDRLNGDAGNIAGVLAALPEAQKQTIEQTLSNYAAHLPERDITKVYSETVGKFNSDAMLYCEENFHVDATNNVVDARGMSDGTLRFLAILTALLTRPEGSLLIIEEVDNGLHPSRAHLLLKVLNDVGARRSVDVIITTHNPALLDEMGTEMVPYITVAHRSVETGATELTLLENVTQLPKLLSQGQIGKLSSKGLIEKALKVRPADPRQGSLF